MRTGQTVVVPEHLLLGILRHADNDAVRALVCSGADPAKLKRDLEEPLFRDRPVPYDRMDEVGFSRSAGNILSLAVMEAYRAGAEKAGAVHLLMSLVKSAGSRCSALLSDSGVTAGKVASFMKAAGCFCEEDRDLPPSAEEIAQAIVEQLEARRSLTRSGGIYS